MQFTDTHIAILQNEPVILLDELVLDGTGHKRPVRLKYIGDACTIIEERTYVNPASSAHWMAYSSTYREEGGNNAT